MSANPRLTNADMEVVRKLIDSSGLDLSSIPVDGYVRREITKEEVEYRIELGKTRFQLDMLIDRERAALQNAANANYKLGVSKEREEIIQARLDEVAGERDLAQGEIRSAQRKATLWMLASWALFLVLVVAITWRWRGI